MRVLKLLLKSLVSFHFDDSTRFEILKLLGSLVFPKYRFKWYQMLWWENNDFNKYLEKFNELPDPNTDRRWMLHELLKLTQDIPGDTAECGVYLGSSSYLICDANRRSKHPKKHFGFDSFQGLSTPTEKDGSYWKAGDLSASFDICCRNLSDFENVSLLPGWIPTRFSEVESNRFSFIHVDVDIYEPTKASLEFFYQRLEPGGIFLCDDYGFTSCPGATRAVDEFMKDKVEKVLSLPDGGGFFIKSHFSL